MDIRVGAADFGTILICAERYAIGRLSYMPGLVCDYVRANLAADPGRSRTALIMARDIREYREEQGRWASDQNEGRSYPDSGLLCFEALLPMLDEYAGVGER